MTMVDPNEVTGILITKECCHPTAKVLQALAPEFEWQVVKDRSQGIRTRYDWAARADRPHIFVIDDDCLVDPMKLLEHYDGEHVTNYMEPHYAEEYAKRASGRITLVGWGAFFPKLLIALAFSKYQVVYGRDELCLSQADRIFTYLTAPHRTVLTDGILHLRSATASDRMSMQGDHYRMLDEVIGRLEALI